MQTEGSTPCLHNSSLVLVLSPNNPVQNIPSFLLETHANFTLQSTSKSFRHFSFVFPHKNFEFTSLLTQKSHTHHPSNLFCDERQILPLKNFIYSPNDAVVSFLKNNIKIYIKASPTCFGAVTPSAGSALIRPY